MKHLILWIVLFPIATFAQMSQAEFEKVLESLAGNDQQKAMADLEAAEKKYPNTDKAFYLRAVYQFRDGDQNAAMMSQSDAIKANPTFALGYDGRAELFFSKGMYDKAIADETKALQLEPDNINYLMSRIRFYRANKQFTEALADAKTRIRLKPDGILAYLDAAEISKEMDPNSNADDFFTQAYAFKGIQKCDTDAVFGQFLLGQGRFESARDKYESALAACPEFFTADDHNNMGLAYYKMQQYDKAGINFKKARSMAPNNLVYFRNLGMIYIAESDWQKLKDMAMDGLAIDSNDPFCNKFYAIALENTGQVNLANEYNEKAHRLEKEEQARNNN